MLLKLIDRLNDSIGAGANAATLRTQLAAIREQAEAMEADLQELEARVKEYESSAQTQDFRPKQDALDEGAVGLLRLLFEGAELSAEEIAAKLGITTGMAEYHCGDLFQKEMIHPMNIGVAMIGFEEEPSPTTYIITLKGRQYLVKNSLV